MPKRSCKQKDIQQLARGVLDANIPDAQPKAKRQDNLLLFVVSTHLSRIRLVLLLNLCGRRLAAMNPNTIPIGDRFARGESARFDARPAYAHKSVVPGHPRGRIIRMTRMNKNRRAA